MFLKFWFLSLYAIFKNIEISIHISILGAIDKTENNKQVLDKLQKWSEKEESLIKHRQHLSFITAEGKQYLLNLSKFYQ